MTINSEDPSSSPLTEEPDFAGERGLEFAAKRDTYEEARGALQDLYDFPDKSITVSEYRAEVRAAQEAANAAHDAMMAAWPA